MKLDAHIASSLDALFICELMQNLTLTSAAVCNEARDTWTLYMTAEWSESTWLD